MGTTRMTATNTFSPSGGMLLDFDPLISKNGGGTWSNALNATMLTFNGNESMMQQDMGNGRVETAYLPEGYVPLGTCEFGDIIYIVSYNPLENKCQLGCFPSPERNITSDEISDMEQDIYGEEFQSYNEIEETLDSGIVTTKKVPSGLLIATSVKKILYGNDNMNPGDKFLIYEEDSMSGESSSALDANKYTLTDYGNSANEHNGWPKLLKLNVVSIEDSGKIVDLNASVKWYNNDYYITTMYSESDGTIDLDSYRSLVTSAYSVFTSKVSGKLALLAELTSIDGFSCTYDVYTEKGHLEKEGDPDSFVEGNPNNEDEVNDYTKYKIYFYTAWENSHNDINPSGFLFTKSEWIDSQYGGRIGVIDTSTGEESGNTTVYTYKYEEKQADLPVEDACERNDEKSITGFNSSQLFPYTVIYELGNEDDITYEQYATTYSYNGQIDYITSWEYKDEEGNTPLAAGNNHDRLSDMITKVSRTVTGTGEPYVAGTAENGANLYKYYYNLTNYSTIDKTTHYYSKDNQGINQELEAVIVSDDVINNYFHKDIPTKVSEVVYNTGDVISTTNYTRDPETSSQVVSGDVTTSGTSFTRNGVTYTYSRTLLNESSMYYYYSSASGGSLVFSDGTIYLGGGNPGTPTVDLSFILGTYTINGTSTTIIWYSAGLSIVDGLLTSTSTRFEKDGVTYVPSRSMTINGGTGYFIVDVSNGYCAFLALNGNLYYAENSVSNPSYDLNTILGTYVEDSGITTITWYSYQEETIKSTMSNDLSNLIWNYTVAPAMPYGVLDWLSIDGNIDFSKIGSGEIDLVEWRYYNSSETSTLTWGLECYPEPNKGVAEVVFDFYDNQGGCCSYHIADKSSFSGTFTESIVLGQRFSSYKITNVNAVGDTYYHAGESVDSANVVSTENYLYLNANTNAVLGPMTPTEASTSGLVEATYTAYKDDSGTLYANMLYLVKITVKYCNKDLMDEYDTSDSSGFRYFYRWYYTNGVFNESYYNVKDFDVLQPSLQMDLSVTFDTNEGSGGIVALSEDVWNEYYDAKKQTSENPEDSSKYFDTIGASVFSINQKRATSSSDTPLSYVYNTSGDCIATFDDNTVYNLNGNVKYTLQQDGTNQYQIKDTSGNIVYNYIKGGSAPYMFTDMSGEFWVIVEPSDVYTLYGVIQDNVIYDVNNSGSVNHTKGDIKYTISKDAPSNTDADGRGNILMKVAPTLQESFNSFSLNESQLSTLNSVSIKMMKSEITINPEQPSIAYSNGDYFINQQGWVQPIKATTLNSHVESTGWDYSGYAIYKFGRNDCDLGSTFLGNYGISAQSSQTYKEDSITNSYNGDIYDDANSYLNYIDTFSLNIVGNTTLGESGEDDSYIDQYGNTVTAEEVPYYQLLKTDVETCYKNGIPLCLTGVAFRKICGVDRISSSAGYYFKPILCLDSNLLSCFHTFTLNGATQWGFNEAVVFAMGRESDHANDAYTKLVKTTSTSSYWTTGSLTNNMVNDGSGNQKHVHSDLYGDQFQNICKSAQLSYPISAMIIGGIDISTTNSITSTTSHKSLAEDFTNASISDYFYLYNCSSSKVTGPMLSSSNYSSSTTTLSMNGTAPTLYCPIIYTSSGAYIPLNDYFYSASSSTYLYQYSELSDILTPTLANFFISWFLQLYAIDESETVSPDYVLSNIAYASSYTEYWNKDIVITIDTSNIYSSSSSTLSLNNYDSVRDLIVVQQSDMSTYLNRVFSNSSISSDSLSTNNIDILLNSFSRTVTFQYKVPLSVSAILSTYTNSTINGIKHIVENRSNGEKTTLSFFSNNNFSLNMLYTWNETTMINFSNSSTIYIGKTYTGDTADTLCMSISGSPEKISGSWGQAASLLSWENGSLTFNDFSTIASSTYRIEVDYSSGSGSPAYLGDLPRLSLFNTYKIDK